MSASNIISPNNNKILDRYLPNPYPYPASPSPLGAVLSVGNQAGDQDIVGLNELEARKIVQQQGLGEYLQIGDASGGDLRIFGATTKGSLLAGNGTSTVGLPVGANGLVLKANSATPTGLEWAIDISGVTGVVGVNAGTNIDISGTVSQPIINFATPTTSNILIGVGTELRAQDNYSSPNFAMTLDATGFNDIYSSGGVVNQEDIAVSSTNVVQTLSATQASDYTNSAILTCNTNFVNDVRTSQILTTGFEKTATVNLACNTSGSQPVAGITCGVNAPTTSPFPDVVATIGMSCSDTTNPNISLSQSAPFATSYITTFDKDGINQNNSAGAGFNLQTAQNLTLTCPSANKIIVPNGNDIDLSTVSGGATFTTEYRKDGYTSQGFLAGNYSGQVQAFQSGGSSQMFISSSNLASASTQYLRLESTFGGDCAIEHNATAGRNLNITSTNNLTMSADNVDLDSTGRLILPSLASGDYLDYNAGSLKIVNDSVAGSANPLLVLQNNNNTAGAVTYETYKNDLPTSTGGDNIASWSATCNTNVGKTEISRVNHIAYGTGASNNDGGVAIACKVNSAITNFLICNGGANNAVGNGEIQVFKPITSVSPNNLNIICPTAGGTAKIQSVSNIELEATGDNLTTISGANTTISTTGLGSQIEFKPEATAGKIVFTGASLQSGSSSGNSGQHLVITLNGTVYKIALENP